MASPKARAIAWWWSKQLDSPVIDKEDETYRTLRRQQRNRTHLGLKELNKFFLHLADLIDDHLDGKRLFRIGGCGIGEIDTLIVTAARMAGINAECEFLFPPGCGTEVRRGVIYVWTRREPAKVVLPPDSAPS